MVLDRSLCLACVFRTSLALQCSEASGELSPLSVLQGENLWAPLMASQAMCNQISPFPFIARENGFVVQVRVSVDAGDPRWRDNGANWGCPIESLQWF